MKRTYDLRLLIYSALKVASKHYTYDPFLTVDANIIIMIVHLLFTKPLIIRNDRLMSNTST